ncbi:hypothetical protein PROFUN_07457 [Planoprotostelium fungivorum]|uniref:Endonuclease/exonuclease/phosphatase domain-containing protein n=1 Tax=Planoprotostelium fungivorum TaxID=1890364 RepID=A0A2P6NLG4_9EUKA|nr:hypothetical protein PROFUN_07457 [Planoprotostelium fungivorum]
MNVNTATMNIDASNRHRLINNANSLVNHVHQQITLEPTSIAVLTESQRYTGEKVCLQFQEEWYTDHAQLSSSSKDYACILWNGEMYSHIESYHSNIGKYAAVHLEHADGHNILTVAVHHPHKKGKENARRLTSQFIEEMRDKVGTDTEIITGDFNCQPHQLNHWIPDGLNFAFHDNSCPTTDTRTPDNTLFSDSLFAEVSYSVSSHFTHKPHYVQL